MNEIIKLGLTLMAITIVAALALAFTNQITLPYIEQNSDMAVKDSLANAYPDADDFNEQEGYFEALKEGNIVGKVYNVGSTGYSSVVQLLVGIDNDNVLKGVAVVSQSETPGLGARVVEDEFLQQFKDVKLEESILSKDGGKIDAITGATITSRAAVTAIQQIEPNLVDADCDNDDLDNEGLDNDLEDIDSDIDSDVDSDVDDDLDVDSDVSHDNENNSDEDSDVNHDDINKTE